MDRERIGELVERDDIEWTARQRQVLDLLARGYTNPQIGEALGLTLDGAKWHVSEVLTKLGVASREEAAAYWRVYRSPSRRLRRGLRALAPAGWLQWAGMGGAGAVVAVAAFAFALVVLGSDDDGLPEPRAGLWVAAVVPVEEPIVEDGDFAYPGMRLQMAHVEDGEWFRLATEGSWARPVWSPGGSRVAAFEGGAGATGDSRLVVIDPFTGEEFVYQFEGETRLERLHWSPDGSRIAALLVEGEERRVMILTDEAVELGQQALRIVEGTPPVEGGSLPSWSPDAGHFVVPGSEGRTWFVGRDGEQLMETGPDERAAAMEEEWAARGGDGEARFHAEMYVVDGWDDDGRLRTWSMWTADDESIAPEGWVVSGEVRDGQVTWEAEPAPGVPAAAERSEPATVDWLRDHEGFADAAIAQVQHSPPDLVGPDPFDGASPRGEVVIEPEGDLGDLVTGTIGDAPAVLVVEVDGELHGFPLDVPSAWWDDDILPLDEQTMPNVPFAWWDAVVRE